MRGCAALICWSPPSATGLAIANAPLCPRTVPRTGLVLHTIGQYPARDRAVVRQQFGFAGDVAISSVVPGSAADAAGLRANLALVSIDGQPVDVIAANVDAHDARSGPVAQLDAVRDAIEAGLAANGAVTIGSIGPQGRSDASLAPRRGCLSRFELELRDDNNARADGVHVAIDRGLFNAARDEGEVAVVLAHELAHNILGHDRLLGSPGVRTAGIRAAEIAADRLSLYLLANAGYDPARAAIFWDHAPRTPGLHFLARHTHLKRSDRVAMLRRDAAVLAAVPRGQLLVPPEQ